MSNHILRKFIDTIPGTFSPEGNSVILALLTALAESDEFLNTQAQNAKDQLFVKSASGVGLDRLGDSVGVVRPPTLGMTDGDFRELIPHLSLRPKQIKQAFYNVADIFFSPLFTRTNLTTSNTATFNLNIGDELLIRVDGGAIQSLIIKVGDVVAPGLMTAEEVITWLGRLEGVTASTLVDPVSGNESVNIRTNTPGSVGTLEILSSSAIGTGMLEFEIKKSTILDLGQRFTVYNINPNELLIEIPAAIPALRRTLLGSHHFHLDDTLEPPIAPENGIWVGSFLHDPSGSQGGFTITGQSATLQSDILAGTTTTTINVSSTAGFEDPSGALIFNFGREEQEQPVSYISVINANTVAIDPAYVFTQTHLIGREVNVISSNPMTPRVTGGDYSIYLPSPVAARVIVQNLLERLKAAGIILRFEVILPKYIFRCDSPFTELDDAPKI